MVYVAAGLLLLSHQYCIDHMYIYGCSFVKFIEQKSALGSTLSYTENSCHLSILSFMFPVHAFCSLQLAHGRYTCKYAVLVLKQYNTLCFVNIDHTAHLTIIITWVTAL